MKDIPNKERSRKSKGKGCLVACLVIIGLVAYIFWQIGAPGRHARHMHGAIQKGMSLGQLENLLKNRDDRHFLWFQIFTDGKWETVPRDEFIRTASTPTGNLMSHARVQLTFMGLAPNRVTFFVELDSTGRVSQITTPYGWD